MAPTIAREEFGAGVDAIPAHIAAEGVAFHPYLRDIDIAFAGAEGMRDLADAVHFLCVLHGRHPGMIEDAAAVTSCAATQRWLAEIAPAFTAERRFVTRLAVAAGGVPSTPGSAECEAVVAGQCHALQMLARSERRGCPLGAAVALLLDWNALRPLLDQAAARLGSPSPPRRLPGAQDIAETLARIAPDPAIRRALAFGAAQVFAQHRGLLDLLEARRSARREA